MIQDIQSYKDIPVLKKGTMVIIVCETFYDNIIVRYGLHTFRAANFPCLSF